LWEAEDSFQEDPKSLTRRTVMAQKKALNRKDREVNARHAKKILNLRGRWGGPDTNAVRCEPIVCSGAQPWRTGVSMLKFMVVLYKKPGMTEGEFHRFLREVHGSMALRIPGLRRYVQNHVVPDATRKHPGWDAIVELSFEDWTSMEVAWATPEGKAATADVGQFADLGRTTWSVVEEEVRAKAG